MLKAGLDTYNKQIHFYNYVVDSFIHQLTLITLSLSTPLQSAFPMACFCSLSGICVFLKTPRFLNQACTGARLVSYNHFHSANVCVYACVCVYAPEAINN